MIFTGTFENKVDAKGRISVPAPFRALIKASASNEVALFPSFRFQGLEGMTFDTLMALSQQQDVATVDFFSEAKPNKFSILFRTTQRLVIDEAGRINLPDSLIAHAGLAKAGVFTGEGHSFALWSPAAYADRMQRDMAAVTAHQAGAHSGGEDTRVNLALAARSGDAQ